MGVGLGLGIKFRSYLEVWGSGLVGCMLYISPLSFTGESGQSYGSVPISGRTPSPNCQGHGMVVFEGLGSVRSPLTFLGLVRYDVCGLVQSGEVFRRTLIWYMKFV